MRRWRCRPYRALLVDSADGRLSPAQQQRLERHLPGCSACREELTALREVPSLLRATAIPEPDTDFWRRQQALIGQAIRHATAPRPPRTLGWLRVTGQPSPWRYPIAVAAGLLLALGIYRYAADHQRQAPDGAERELAGLDTDALTMLHDVMQALEPADQQTAADPDDSALLAAAPLSNFGTVIDLPPVLETSDLSDNELEGLDTLVGDEFG